MSLIELRSGSLSLQLSTKGGLILGFWQEDENGRVPLLRDAPDDADALSSSCYPLVPFGNRVKDNRFEFEGEEYLFTANTSWDPHYLHGEGWQSDWTVDVQADDHVVLSFSHRGNGTPYIYKARQQFSLTNGGLEIVLSVENAGDRALPFGLGWHPYFPMTPGTTLFAPARKFWTEVEGWLPGEATELPADLDFREPSPLPHRWVNNGLQDWSGEAIVTWPERDRQLHLTADALFQHAFIFVSDTAFDPQFKRDYFCFEPMSHLANGQNMPDLGGLQVLQPGQQLSGGIRLRPQTLEHAHVL